RPALVVTLTHLPMQWAAEIKRFAPQLRTHILEKATPYDVRYGSKVRKRMASRPDQIELLDEGPFPDVLISNYHKLHGWAETLSRIVKSIFYDECQELRRCESAKYQAARMLSEAAQYRMGLSATPFFNYGGEMYSVLDAIRPGGLGTPSEFLAEWCRDTSGGGVHTASLTDPKAFGTYARDAGIMLRRTRADVGRELPKLTKVPHHIDADAAD